MKNLTRVSVITERGRLVGVYIPSEGPASDPKAPAARIVAGPGQKIRDVQVEMPAEVRIRKDVDALHAAVRRKLKLRK